MGKLTNFTVEELEELLNDGDLTVEGMYDDYMDATGKSDLIYINFNVGRDLNKNTLDFREFASRADLEEYLLTEDISFTEEMNDILMNLTLDIVEAFTVDGTDFFEDDAFSIVEDVRMSLDGKVNFEIDFDNEPIEFSKWFRDEHEYRVMASNVHGEIVEHKTFTDYNDAKNAYDILLNDKDNLNVVLDAVVFDASNVWISEKDENLMEWCMDVNAPWDN